MMPIGRLLLFIGLTAGVVPLCHAQAQRQPGPAPLRLPTAGVYRISGKVVDAHTGAALARASVRIADVKDRGETQSTVCGEDGTFAFPGLKAGKYSLAAERRGYLEQAYEEHDQFSTAIAVGPGLDSESLLFKLTAEAVLSGTITDEAGEPVRGAQVRLFQDQAPNGIRTTAQRSTTTTDDRGVYELAALRPGAYFLVVTSHPWYAQRLQQSGEGATTSGSQSLDVAYPTTFYPGVSDQDSATPIPLKGGDRLEANLTLAAQPALRVRLNLPGTATDRGVSVTLNQSIFGQVEMAPTQITMANGAVELEGLLPGHYDVAVSAFTPGEGRGETKHFNADLSGGATEISEDSGVGEVTVTGKVISAAGKLPARAGISLRPAQGRRQQQHYAELNEAGEFKVDVAPGVYEVAGGINGMYIASLKATGAALAGRMLTLKAGDSPKLEVTAAAGHGEIEGLALRGDKPASAVMILLAPEDAKNNEILFRRDQSDSDGTFDLPNIVPGRYHLLAIGNGWQLEWANPAVLQAFLGKSIAVEVKSGDHLNREIQVQAQ